LKVAGATITTAQISSIQSAKLLSDRTVIVRLMARSGPLECRTQLKEERFTRFQCAPPLTAGAIGELPPPDSAPSTTPSYQALNIDWSRHSEVARLCEVEFSGLENEKLCMQAMQLAKKDPRKVISTCVENMRGDEDELRCIFSAVRGAGAELVNACVSTIDGDDHEAKCIEQARKAHSAGPAIVRACGSMLVSDLDELSCISWASAQGTNGLDAVRSCDSIMSDEQQKLACVGAALRSGFSTTKMIAACKELAPEAIATLSCIQLGARAEADPSAIISGCRDRHTDLGARLNCVGQRIDGDIERAARKRGRSSRL